MSNQCIKINYDVAFIQNNAEICQLTEVRKYANTCTFVVPVFQPWFHSNTIFFPFCFMSNIYYLSKLMLLNYHCQKIPFLCKHIFLLMRNKRNET